MGKTLYVTDFDDTLAKTDAKIYLTKKNGKEVTLTPGQYASYEEEDGDRFDFSDFEGLKNPRPINRFVNLLKKVLDEKKAHKVTVLTARGHTKPIKTFLEMMGIKGNVTIAALGNADPQLKAKYIEKHINDGYDRIAFIDDSEKNIKAVDALKAKHPHIKLLTHHAKEDGTLTASKIDVRPIQTKEELAQVKDWILNKHYIKRWPSATQAKLGVYIGDKLHGILLYGATNHPTAGTQLFQKDGAPVMQNNQTWELLRAYTDEEAKGVSNIGSMAIAKGNEYIRTQAKTTDGKPVLAIVTYADANVGHSGGVYKATNAAYLGPQKPGPIFVVTDPKSGVSYDMRSMSPSAKDKLEDKGLKVTRKMGIGKHKYIYALGKSQRERDALMSTLTAQLYSYPKDAGSSSPIENPAKEKPPTIQKTQEPDKKSTVIKQLLQSKVKNPETGNTILVKTALKYDKTHPSYRQAMGMVQAYAKKHNIRLRNR